MGGLFSRNQLTQEDLDLLEETLHGADFGVEAVDTILGQIRQAQKKNRELRGKDAAEIAIAVLSELLTGSEGRLSLQETPPTVITMLGVNGSGKTTTTAKLAHLWQKQDRRVLIGACDTFRAAANEQLRTWCDRLGVELVASQQGADAAAVAYDSLTAARQRGSDVLLLDTAGRLHTKGNLMEELKKIRRVLAKLDPTSPHESWLVVDGSIGSNSIEQARVFHQSFGLTGLIVTKLDGTSKGGSLAAIYRELALPIHYIGLGEQAEDLMPFNVSEYARSVFSLAE